jgi:hypothetical protein
MVIDHQLNPGKYTQEQLKQNADAAYDAYDYAYDAVAFSAKVAYFAAYDAYAFAYADAATYWLGRYFEFAGENKQDYIDAINKDSN